MKKTFYFWSSHIMALAFSLGMASIAGAQDLLLHESFTTTLDSISSTAGQTFNGWEASTGAGPLILSSTSSDAGSSLSYPNFAASTGKRVSLINRRGVDVARRTGGLRTDSLVYFSFLLKVRDTLNLAKHTDNTTANSGSYFTGFATATANYNAGRVYLRKGVGNTFQLGLQNNTGGTPVAQPANMYENSQNYIIGQTYLVVGSYLIRRAASTNEVAKIYVNPTLGQPEPATPTLLSDKGTNQVDSVIFVYIRQSGTAASLNTPNADIDEIRVGRTWAAVTPSATTSTPTLTASPAALSFGAVQVGTSVIRKYAVSGTNLTGTSVAISLPTGLAGVEFKRKADAAYTAAALSLTITAGSATDSIFVRYSPTAAVQTLSGNISHSAGTTTAQVSLSGSSVAAPVPVVIQYRTIAQVRGNSVGGLPDSLTRRVMLTGTVNSPNYRPAGLEFQITDFSGGIVIFKNPGTVNNYSVTLGDSIRAFGLISQFNGNAQLSVDSIRVISQNRAAAVPIVLTDTLIEANEGRLVRITGVKLFRSNTWRGTSTNTSSFNIEVRKGALRYSVRILSATALAQQTLAQIGLSDTNATFTITGIGWQFQGSAFGAPFRTGYQLYLRSAADISSVTSNKTKLSASSIAIYPNPATDQITLVPATGISQVLVSVIDALGRTLISKTAVMGTSVISTTALPTGLYTVLIESAQGQSRQNILIKR